jgi:hypothetical protein
MSGLPRVSEQRIGFELAHLQQKIVGYRHAIIPDGGRTMCSGIGGTSWVSTPEKRCIGAETCGRYLRSALKSFPQVTLRIYADAW